jgi:membrane-bound metal-dependent hydrolase YbcI (DUF457 family)
LSSYGTHMLIGAVGGLALTRLVNVHSPDMAPIVVEGVVVIGSALLATWPDIDEPNSFIARRARAVVTLIGTGLGGVIGYAQAARFAHPPVVGAGIGALAGLLIGSLLAILLLKGIRLAAGGHRRLTHSLVVGGLLAALAGALGVSGVATVAFVLGALAWGQVLHLLGDIVTPAGVPVLYPFSGRDLRVLPSGLARFGEQIAGVSALLLAYMLVRI